jgi:hypothetical protein
LRDQFIMQVGGRHGFVFNNQDAEFHWGVRRLVSAFRPEAR